MNYRIVARKLKSLGCVEILPRARGSHRQWHNSLTDKYAIIPDHGSKDLKKGTIRGAIRRLGINWQDFKN